MLGYQFLRNIVSDEQHQHSIELLYLCGHLNVKTAAEAVETKEHVEMLNEFQGEVEMLHGFEGAGGNSA